MEKKQDITKEEMTISKLTNYVEKSSSDFERQNTDLKRKYLIWNIEVFNIIASSLKVCKGTFGTGYPFYALDEKLQGKLPIISEQIRYNRQLVKDGEVVGESIWNCKSCLERNYKDMPDLKAICKPCPNMSNELKPRKIINRLPDMDMWMICEDGKVEEAQNELTELMNKYEMRTSDVDPLKSIQDVSQISKMIKKGKMPKIFLPIDSHIIEYSKIKELIEKVPTELKNAKKNGEKPYLPIRPKSYRKQWQYDDDAYNYIYDYLSAFTTFDIPNEMQCILNRSRKEITSCFSKEELFEFLLNSATPANFRRFQTTELENIFMKKMDNWREIDLKKCNRIDEER